MTRGTLLYVRACVCVYVYVYVYNILCKRRNILCQTLLERESPKYNMIIYEFAFVLAHYSQRPIVYLNFIMHFFIRDFFFEKFLNKKSLN